MRRRIPRGFELYQGQVGASILGAEEFAANDIQSHEPTERIFSPHRYENVTRLR